MRGGRDGGENEWRKGRMEKGREKKGREMMRGAREKKKEDEREINTVRKRTSTEKSRTLSISNAQNTEAMTYTISTEDSCMALQQIGFNFSAIHRNLQSVHTVQHKVMHTSHYSRMLMQVTITMYIRLNTLKVHVVLK